MQHLMNLAVFLFLYKYFEAILIVRRIEFLVNGLKIIVGVTLIWRKTVTAIHLIALKNILALFKFGGQAIQTAKLKSPPSKPRMRYI